jgi:predicted phosphoribosyltransferase
LQFDADLIIYVTKLVVPDSPERALQAVSGSAAAEMVRGIVEIS